MKPAKKLCQKFKLATFSESGCCTVAWRQVQQDLSAVNWRRMLNCAATQHYGHSIGLYLRLYFLLWPNWPKPDWTGRRTNASALEPSVYLVHTSNGGAMKCAIRRERTDCNSMSTQTVVFAHNNDKMNDLRQRMCPVDEEDSSMWFRHGRTVWGSVTSNSLRPAWCRITCANATSNQPPSVTS